MGAEGMGVAQEHSILKNTKTLTKKNVSKEQYRTLHAALHVLFGTNPPVLVQYYLLCEIPSLFVFYYAECNRLLLLRVGKRIIYCSTLPLST